MGLNASIPNGSLNTGKTVPGEKTGVTIKGPAGPAGDVGENGVEPKRSTAGTRAAQTDKLEINNKLMILLKTWDRNMGKSAFQPIVTASDTPQRL